MPKRKRSEFYSSNRDNYTVDTKFPITDQVDGEESSRSIAIQQKTIEQKIHHYRIVLKRALKTAKGFEQQKLGKRIKAARKGKGLGSKAKDGKDEVDRLEKELEGLKEVDLTSLAASYLNKTLLKNKRLVNAKYFPLSVAKEAEEQSKQPAPSGPVANVCARLLNANPVKEAVKEIIGSLGQLLGLEDEETAGQKPVGNESKHESVPRKVDVVGRIEEDDDMDMDSDAESEIIGDNDEDGVDEDEEVVHPSMLKNLARKYLTNGGMISSEDEEDASELDERIVLSSEDEESGVERTRGRSMSITPIPEDQANVEGEESEDEDLDEDSDEDEDISEPEVVASASRKKDAKPSKQDSKSIPTPSSSAPIKASSFLPTLMSGYISGSESDASSLASDNTRKKKKGPAQKKIRKNRMGQQARRALAEKKFGTGANHIKKAKEEKEAKVKLKEEKRKAWKEKQEKPVHQSWQLKNKDKEEKTRIVKSLMAGDSKPLGKKIVFD